MARRYPARVGMVLLGLLPCLGCMTMSIGVPGAAPAPADETAAAPGPELPSGKAGQLCLQLARSLEKGGHDAEAAGQYELARQYDPHLDVSHRLAVIYDRLGNAARAQEEFERALGAHPKDADLLNDLGYHSYNRGQWSEAEHYLRRALEINPKHGSAWMNLGMTLAQQGRYPDSLEAFRHCVGAAEAQCNLGFFLTAQGKREEAKRAYEEALRLEPGLRLARAALAKLEPTEQHPAGSAAEKKSRPDGAAPTGRHTEAPPADSAEP